MSRNLCSNRCPECDKEVTLMDLVGCKMELRRYYSDPIRPLLNYTCSCGRHLLAWVMWDYVNETDIDLSYYESFNDEPNKEGDANVYYKVL